MDTKAVSIIVIIIVVIAGVWYFVMQPPSAAPVTSDTSNANALTAPAATATSSQAVTIMYTGSGFSPANVTVQKGQTVTWVNQSSGKMWIASGVHPLHTLYDGTSVAQHCTNGAPNSASVFDQCAATGAGSSFSFTFDKVGSWTYHNHTNPTSFGTVVVQ